MPVARLLRQRRGSLLASHHRSSRSRWPEESGYLLMMLAGLVLLGFVTYKFHKHAGERSDALAQLRAAKQARSSGSDDQPVGLASRNAAGQHAGAADALDAVHGMLEEARQLAEQTEQAAMHADTAGGGGEGGNGAVAAAAGLAGTHVAAAADGAADDYAAGAGGQHSQEKTDLSSYCEQHFGLDWLQRWGATARQVCAATQQLVAGAAGGGAASPAPSTITCRSMNDTHMPAAAAPHVLCDATNLRLYPAKLVRRESAVLGTTRSRCPLHRPGYLCVSPTYHRYAHGAWAVDCDWPGFSLEAFSRDHERDIFGSFVFQPELGTGGGGNSRGASAAAAAGEPAEVETLPTLLVTREAREHANVFHTYADILNVYITLRMLGWEHSARQVVLLDAHPPGGLDLLWPVVAAGGGPAAWTAIEQQQQQRGEQQQPVAPRHGRQRQQQRGPHPWDVAVDGRLLVRRVEEFKRPVLFRHAAFVPPGYTSLLFADLYEDASCPLPTRLFAGFRRFMLDAFGVQGGEDSGSMGSSTSAGSAGSDGAAAAGGLRAAEGSGGLAAEAAAERTETGDDSSGSSGGGPLVVRLISRRPGAGKKAMARQIGNEDELLAALQRVPGVQASLMDFAGLSVPEQLQMVQSTDILVGMHGAALAHALLMPPHAALVELWPQADGIWRCYQNFAQWAGALYRRVANADPARHQDTPQGDVTEVDVGAVAAAVHELAPLVAERRAQARIRGGSGADSVVL